MDYQKVFKILIKFWGILAFVLGFSLLLVLNAFLAPILSFGLIALDLVYILAGLALASYLGDFSIPGIKTLLRREYYRIKFHRSRKREKQTKPGALSTFYLKTLAHLITLFKSAQEGYEVIMEEAEEIYGKTALILKKEKKALSQDLRHAYFFQAHKLKQIKWASISAGTLIISVVLVLSFSLLFSYISPSRAAVYTWIQESWSGGATTTAIAGHGSTTSEQNWTYYKSADSRVNINGEGDIEMSSTLATSSESRIIEENSATEFNAGTLGTDNGVCLVEENGELKLINQLSYGGQNYSVVQINNRCWMAENLNIGERIDFYYSVTYDGDGNVTDATINPMTDNGVLEKYCFKDNPANCETYGAHYMFGELSRYEYSIEEVTSAMAANEVDGILAEIEGIQGICPDGWHIPTDAEYHILESYYATGSCDPNRQEGLVLAGTNACSPAGTALRVGGESGFNIKGSNFFLSGSSYVFGMEALISSTFVEGAEGDQVGVAIRVSVPGYSGLGRTISAFVLGGYDNSAVTLRCIKDQ